MLGLIGRTMINAGVTGMWFAIAQLLTLCEFIQHWISTFRIELITILISKIWNSIDYEYQILIILSGILFLIILSNKIFIKIFN